MNTEETKKLENNSINVKTYIEKCLETYEITDFRYNEERNWFEARENTNTISTKIKIRPEKDKIIFHAIAELQIPKETYWEVLDYINDINATANRYPRLYIVNIENEFYLLEAEYRLLIQNPMKANIFIEMLSALIRILEDYAPNILRIILDIETEKN